MNFIECDTCHAKPGTPQLCLGCLQNREEITKCHAALKELKWTDVEYNALAVAHDKLQDQVAAWRHNYRTALEAMHDENNLLRTMGAELSARLTQAEHQPARKFFDRFFKRRSEV